MITQADRKTKSFRLSFADEVLSRLERLEDQTRCPADTRIELATNALLDTFRVHWVHIREEENMRTMKTILLIAALAAAATVGYAQDMSAMTPTERACIFAVCDKLDARFAREAISNSGQAVLWAFELKQSIHSIPVIVAVVSYPTNEQIFAADLAARTAAEQAYIWMKQPGNYTTADSPTL